MRSARFCVLHLIIHITQTIEKMSDWIYGMDRISTWTFNGIRSSTTPHRISKNSHLFTGIWPTTRRKSTPTTTPNPTFQTHSKTTTPEWIKSLWLRLTVKKGNFQFMTIIINTKSRNVLVTINIKPIFMLSLINVLFTMFGQNMLFWGGSKDSL